MDLTKIQVRPIDKLTALALIFEYHYSKIMPRLTDIYLGGFIDDELIGVLTLGWGVRPHHTIHALFPSLSTQDYYEIGKMCLAEKMPKNSESVFLSRVIAWLKQNTDKKLLYTWADGILGKPGYVYQAANFLYGEFIWTDLYISKDGEKIHPRTAQGITNQMQKKTVKLGHRPTRTQLKSFEWNHYRGKQFRYLYFLCDRRQQKQLLAESTVPWTRTYPKQSDLEWKIQDLTTGEWASTTTIVYNPNTSNDNNKSVRTNARKVWSYNKGRDFFDY